MQKTIILIIILLLSNILNAQDELNVRCEKYLDKPFVSDGQQYRAIIDTLKNAKFKVIFYGNTTYRVICCSDSKDGKIVYNLYDSQKNLLFTNKKHYYTPYWNFQFKETTYCTIEVQKEAFENNKSEVMLIIGFKQ